MRLVITPEEFRNEVYVEKTAEGLLIHIGEDFAVKFEDEQDAARLCVYICEKLGLHVTRRYP